MTSNDTIKALTAALNAMGFSQADKLTVYQIGELEQIMKDEYGIEIHIKDNGKVEARGEQTELVEHVEKGEKIQPQSIRSVSQSKIKQQAYQTIDASILTPDEKSELKQRIEKHNFVKSKEKPEETVENLKTAVERKEKQENTKETVHEQSEAEKLLHLRGTKRKTPQKSAAPGLSVTTATVAKNLKNIANGGR